MTISAYSIPFSSLTTLKSDLAALIEMGLYMHKRLLFSGDNIRFVTTGLLVLRR